MSKNQLPKEHPETRTQRKHSEHAVLDGANPDVGRERAEVQPGTATEGRSWQSRSPQLENKDDQLDQALKDSFPASDPPQAAQPGVTGWDLKDEEKK